MKRILSAVLTAVCLAGTAPAQPTTVAATTALAIPAPMKVLRGHVPAVAGRLASLGRLASTNEIRLAIGVALRDPAELDQFLAAVYDPASPIYRHYLTPEEFTARFGPTERDYQAVKDFALTNGFKITAEHGNRLLLDVAAKAPDVERAFHVTLNRFQHPTEAREFFAPDAEPTVDVALPVADIQGLSNYGLPRPKSKHIGPRKSITRDGSGPDGSGAYFGNDFRNAYVPGTTLTGAGQMVGLFQGDGFYAGDIATYAQQAGGGRTNIVIKTVLLDGFDGVPTTGEYSGESEVALDIEMAMAMAPGLSKIIVFEGNPNYYVPNDILNSMAASNTVKNLSSSWGWSEGPNTTTDAIFRQMASQGQSFFDASGDTDAFTAGANSINGVDNLDTENAPADSPYITQVGGTSLTMNGIGTLYNAETVWNWGAIDPYDYDGVGSSGGVSSHYSLPTWQASVSNWSSRGGSSSFRNTPDVALTAENVYVVSGGSGVGAGRGAGTSVAAPLWAGFMALVNQQAAASGKSSAGFINPAIYTIAAGANYTNCFHDITTGNNAWSESPGLFYAMSGYDLCTGLGTPKGTGLINALAGVATTPALPNLTPYQPDGWSGAMVVATTAGTTTDSSTYRTTDTLYIDWAIANNGAVPTAAGFDIQLLVDGKIMHTFSRTNPLTNEWSSSYTDFPVSPLAAGDHTISLVIDSGHVVTESDETDNTNTRTITVTAPLVNDQCSGAIPISSSSYANIQSTVGATSTGDPSDLWFLSAGVWYVFTPVANGTVAVDTTGSSFDTVLAMYSGSCGSMSRIAYNDDLDPGNIITSGLANAVTGGATYYFLIGGYQGDVGTLDFHLNFTAAVSCSSLIFTNPAVPAGGATGQVCAIQPSSAVSSVTNTFNLPAWITAVTLQDANHNTLVGGNGSVITVTAFPYTIAFNVAANPSTDSRSAPVVAMTYATCEQDLVLTQAGATPPPVLSNPLRLSGGQFQFNLSGIVGTNYVVQSSADLKTWTTLASVTLTNSCMTNVDATLGLSRRFYRAKLSP